ncbi:C-type lectin domain family 10 member A-like [Tachysurus fulvidraco]|uniref:C-type lectin domain family 10 member A-like n=1 Tax=Tachysurus fulvidraco TaxID=1234273 RepID=UPI001FEE5931|nr:C-type lectin domain family 10 member A-like [Tachysurus fulvidraco]XP_027012186.2 C-type lectin domain family 10 member A-like [Tachysurus fulvidraco]
MEQSLFILLFFTGFVPLVLSVPRRYYLVQQRKTWSDAQAYSRATHTDLAIIDSNDNMVRLQKEAQSQQFSSSAWIGLYNPINSWRWSVGNKPLGSTGWSSGEPDNVGGHEECGAITPWGWGM